MKLSQIVFNYVLEKKKFDYINYNFGVIDCADSKEQLIEVAKSSLETLKSLIEKNYPSSKFGNKEAGEISSSTIQYGYKFYPLVKLPGEEFCMVGLSYSIGLANAQPRDLRLNLNCTDTDDDRLFSLFDNILAINDLQILPAAKISAERIQMLRSQKFDLNRYLCAAR